MAPKTKTLTNIVDANAVDLADGKALKSRAIASRDSDPWNPDFAKTLTNLTLPASTAAVCVPATAVVKAVSTHSGGACGAPSGGSQSAGDGADGAPHRKRQRLDNDSDSKRASDDGADGFAKSGDGDGPPDPSGPDGAPDRAAAAASEPAAPAQFGLIIKAAHAEKFLGDKRVEIRKTPCNVRQPGDHIYIVSSGRVSHKTVWTSTCRVTWVECKQITSLDMFNELQPQHLATADDIKAGPFF